MTTDASKRRTVHAVVALALQFGARIQAVTVVVLWWRCRTRSGSRRGLSRRFLTSYDLESACPL